MEKGNSGITFNGLLTIVFIILKLTGYINWPWLWVLSPLWGGIIICLLILIRIHIYEIWEERKWLK